MDKMTKKQISKELTIPFIIAFIGAMLMSACIFLPYSTATEEQVEWIEKYPDTMAFEEVGLYARDMKNVSLVKYSQIYFRISEEYWNDSAIGIFYIVLVALVGGGALIAGMFVLGKKPIGSILFGALSCGVFHLLNQDFANRGVIPSDSYDWGITHTLFPIASATLLIGAVWMFVKKIIVKKKMKAQQ